MQQAEWMEQLVFDLLEHYEVEVRPSGLLRLELSMQGHGVLVIEELVKQRQMRVCYLLFDAQGHPVPEPAVLFYIDHAGHWIPYSLQRITAGRYEFADLDVIEGELLVTDAKNQAALALFADFWAETLRAQGWLEDATQSHTTTFFELKHQPPWPDWDTLMQWLDPEGSCEATDGCWVEPDGVCEHGHHSWLAELGLL